MEAAVDWWTRGLSIAGFLLSVIAVGLTWRWRRSHRLLTVHQSLQKVQSAALAHLDVFAGESPTERDVIDLLDEAAYLVGRAPWRDVREAGARVIEECKVVLEPRIREQSTERKDEIRRAVRDAFESASRTIEARADPLARGLGAGQRHPSRR